MAPLAVPTTLIDHHVARFDLACVRDQVYLRPYPKERVSGAGLSLDCPYRSAYA